MNVESFTEITMIQQNEIIVLLLGIGVLIFVLNNRKKFHLVPASRILISGFSLILAGWILAVLKGFFWKDFLKLAAHFCYAASSLLMTVWCWKAFKSGKDKR